MDDPRGPVGDPLDTWLNAEVEPLAPPPGAFERIRRRARRRKAGRVMMSTAGIVIIVVASAAILRIAPAMVQSHNDLGHAAAAAPSASWRPSPARSGSRSPNAGSSTQVPRATSSLSPQGSGSPVPPNFLPTSVTFVGPDIGAVIGQAGTPGHCPIIAADCTSLAGTSDYGSTWYGVSAPVTGAPDGSHGVGQLRFLNTRDGWAFGPELWVTHDGGAHWLQEQTYGMRVTDLETAGSRAFAVFARCAGTGADYAAGCTSFSLYSSPEYGDHWQPVSLPAAAGRRAGPGGGQLASASLVLTGASGGTGYLLAPSGELLSGPLTGARWHLASPGLPCPPTAPVAGAGRAGALLAADANLLVLVCTGPAGSRASSVFASTDGGAHWSRAGTAPGTATSVAVQAQEHLVVVATGLGLYRSDDGGSTWTLAQPSPGGTAAGKPGFSYVGMTTPANGVALPADPALHEVFVTLDGGRHWQPHPVSSP